MATFDSRQHLLEQAIRADDLPALRNALAQGADPRACQGKDVEPTPLMQAAHWGSPACFQELLTQCGAAELSRRGPRGWSAAHYGAHAGSVECLRLCVGVPGWDLPTTLSRHTPLMLAARARVLAAVDFLLPLSDPRALNVEGLSAWGLALQADIFSKKTPEIGPGFARLALACGVLDDHPDSREAFARPLMHWLDRAPESLLAHGAALDQMEALFSSPHAWIAALDVLGAHAERRSGHAAALRIRERQARAESALLSQAALPSSRSSPAPSL